MAVSKFRSLADYPRLPMSKQQWVSEKQFAFRVILATALVGIAAGMVFVLRPDLDFLITNMLREDGRFVLQGDDLWSFVRRFTMWAYGAVYVGMIVGLLQSMRLKRAIWNLYPVHWFYMVMCSLAGPLLVTNIVLKTYVGRPRPLAVAEYGGSLDFVPVFEAGGKCVENCSFVSGEVSSMAMIFAALMFVSATRRWLFGLLLLTAWFFSAFMRVGQGAHFPSDTFFAGIFMILIAAGLYRLIVLSPRNLELHDQ